MKKSSVISIAKRLEWTFKETSEAIKQLYQKESIVDNWEEFINICMDSQSIGDPWYDILKYINHKIAEDDVIEIVSKWLYSPDICFEVWAFFNLEYRKEYSFIYSTTWLSQKNDKKLFLKVGNNTVVPPELTYSYLCDKFLSNLVFNLQVFGRINLRDFYLELLSRVGFLAFKLTIFRDHASWSTIDPNMNIFAKEFIGVLSGRYLSSTNKLDTDRKYWLYYVLVETIREKYGLRGAFREVAKLLGSEKGYTTIHTRYFERKKILKAIRVKQPDYDIRDIVADFYLSTVLEKYLPPSENPFMSVNMSVTKKVKR